MDSGGGAKGELVASASKATILSHHGFASAPGAPRKPKKPKLETYAETAVVTEQPSPTPEPVARNRSRRGADDGGSGFTRPLRDIGNRIQRLFGR